MATFIYHLDSSDEFAHILCSILDITREPVTYMMKLLE